MNFEQADALNEVIRAVGVRHRALSIAALAPFGVHPGHKLILFDLGIYTSGHSSTNYVHIDVRGRRARWRGGG